MVLNTVFSRLGSRIRQIPKTSMVFVVLGLFYLGFLLNLARTCLGMECLGLWAHALPALILSWPWTYFAELFPRDPDLANQAIYRGMALHPSFWPGYAVFGIGFLINLVLLGGILEKLASLIRTRLRRKRTIT